MAAFAVPGACEIDTPSLTENVVALHLGGGAPVTQGLGGRRAERRSLRRGDVTIVPAFERSSWVLEGPMEFLHLYLPPGLLAAAADEVGGSRAPTLQAPFAAEDPFVEQVLLALLEAQRRRDPLAGLQAEALVRVLTLHLLRHHAAAPVRLQPPPPSLARPELARVLDFIEANLDRPIALAELAAVSGLSVFHFARVFRQTVGATPHRYVLERRVERARRLLLADRRLPVIEVAAACGFASPSHFATTFRRLTAVAPRDFRRNAVGR